ncbi:UbiA prenyltransferase [Penicillium canariense]|uniref:UbiA prenyltransferase n=1 Tax=Penicillium canariense TaxID=189055 RepID=A0A9W9IDE1_9EURO|nr:UbiA prenyltransferase [Penicillium canariense]KAJ5175583.1 UbiA prenyltransferase [Penicillium canariense]
MPPDNGSSTPIYRNLIRISRFDRYNSFIGVFGGVWATLVAGTLRIKEDPTSISARNVFLQTFLCFLHCYIFSGAGMVWNDWIDRDIDKNVARTKNRPLASGSLRVAHALWWMLFQFLLSAAILYWMLGGKYLLYTLVPETFLTILYPFGKRPAFKRLHLYPQYLLGLAAVSTVVTGWAAIYGETSPLEAVFLRSRPLSFFAFFWIMFFNTAYSYQDIRDDSKMNVNSFYVFVGKYIRICLLLLGGAVLLGIYWTISPLESVWLWMSWMGIWSASYLEQTVVFDPKKPETGGFVHKRNFALGVWTVVACAVEVMLRA